MTNQNEAWVPTLRRVAGRSLDRLDVTAAEEQYKYTLKCAIRLVTSAIKVSAGLGRLTHRAAELEREVWALGEIIRFCHENRCQCTYAVREGPLGWLD